MKKYVLLAVVIFIASSAGIAIGYFGGTRTIDGPNFENHGEMIEKKVKYINQLVIDGKITQEQADEKIEWMENGFENGFPHKKGMKKHFHK